MKHGFLISFLVISALTSQSQNLGITWSKMYGLPWDDSTESDVHALTMAGTTDGGFILAGSVRAGSVTWCDFKGDTTYGSVWVAKCDATGNVEWQRCHGGGYAEFAVDILQEPNGGYTFLGTTYSNDGDVSGNHSAGQDFWLVKLDSVGNLLWQKCYGGNNGEYASRLIRTAWGGYVMMGSSNS